MCLFYTSCDFHRAMGLFLGFCYWLCLYLFGAERDGLDLKRDADGPEALAQLSLLASR